MDIERKRDMKQQIVTQQKQFLQYKALSQQQQQEEVTRQYGLKEQARQKNISEVMDKMRQLESVE